MDSEQKATAVQRAFPAEQAARFVALAAAFLVPVFYFRVTVESYITLKEILISAAALLICAAAFLNTRGAGRISVRVCALDVLLILFTLFSFVTILFSLNRHESLLAWSQLPAAAVMYFYVSRAAPRFREDLLTAISASATIVAAYTFAASVLSWLRLGETGDTALIQLKNALQIPMGGNNFTAAFLAISIPVTAGLDDREWGRPWKYLALALQAAGLAACFGRIALAALALFLIVWALYLLKNGCLKTEWKALAATVSGALAAAVIFLALSSLPGRTEDVVRDMMIAPEEGAGQGLDSMHMRLFWWKDTLRMIGDHPRGVGYGGFSYMFPKYRTIPETFVPPETRLTTPHSDYLHVLAETGGIGLALFLAVFAFGAIGAAKGLFGKDSKISQAAFASTGILLMTAVYAIADFPLQMPSCRLLFFIALGFAASSVLPRSGKEFSLDGRTAAAVVCAAAVALAWMSLNQRSSFTAQRYVLKEINLQERPAEAIAEFRKAVAHDPKARYAYQYAGSAYDKAGDCMNAISMFNKAVEIEPYDYNAVNYLGVSLARCGRDGEALEYFRRASEIYPAFSNPHVNAGVLYLQRGNIKKAAEHFNAALALNKNLVEVYLELAVIERETGNLKAAARLLATALEIAPENKAAQMEMYRLHGVMRKPGKPGGGEDTKDDAIMKR